MTKEEVCQLFMAGIDCSQVVTGVCAEKCPRKIITVRFEA